MQNGGEEKIKSIEDYFKKSEVLNSYFVGFQLYDLEENEIVFEQNSEKYFTPASNTKLLTLYTSLKYLKDSIAFMNVYEVDGKNVYQPMGDPSFLHPDLKTDERIKNYFENLEEDTIYFSTIHFKDDIQGAGWGWDDYNYSYQTEKSAFPIQSNLLIFAKDSIYPTWIPAEILVSEDYPDRYRRKIDENVFFIQNDGEFMVPFHVNRQLYHNFFIHQNKIMQPFEGTLSENDLRITIFSTPADSVYQRLMQNSDNHIAEQLLLQASQLQFGEMNTEKVIEKAEEDLFSDFADEINWVDGSGLSRYNLFTPNSMVKVVKLLIDEMGIDWLTEILPAGGKSGTIRQLYAYESPRVFAKTGTLRNNHCLSGLVQAESGKWYVFSFMNNHYPGSSTVAKTEMTNALDVIVKLY